MFEMDWNLWKFQIANNVAMITADHPLCSIYFLNVAYANLNISSKNSNTLKIVNPRNNDKAPPNVDINELKLYFGDS